MRRYTERVRVVREGVKAAFYEHAYTFCGQQAKEASPGEGAGGYEGVDLCCCGGHVLAEESCATTGNEKPDLVNDQSLRIATECGKHAPAEVEEEDEGGSGDPYRSEHLQGVYPEYFVCEVYVPEVELTVGPRCEVPDLGLVFELP